MSQFIEGLDRQQTMLLPEHLDDYVDEHSPVRAIDAFVDMLDLVALGFNAQPAATGRPGYHPGLMLRIYLYGYLNQVQSSRRLERECGRNLELIWLTGRLKPDFKTIADFRKDNGPAIRKVCQQFVALCRNMDLLDGDVVAIDGSRFKAVNSKAKNYTRGKLRQKLGEIDKAIERYLGELDRADEVFEQTGTVLPEARMERTLRKLEHLQKEAVRYRSIEQRMDETGETQVLIVRNVHATVFGFELVERRRAQAMPAAHLSSRHPSFLFFDHPNNLGLGKTTLSHLFAPSKVEQTLH